MAKKINMLRAGTFTAMSGMSYTFSEGDLQATAAAYDPTLFAAPIVKGHPQHDAPAYGRIYAVEFADGFLVGTPGKVDPVFAEEVNAGHFDNVSLSLYPPDHPSNPVPGVYYPRHLGFLGAMPPAVKGLGFASLSEVEEGLIQFSEMDMKQPTKKEKKSMAVKDRASFCADCSDNVCMPCCPVDAITMTADKGAVIDATKCTVCYKCIDACRMMCDPVYGMQVANYSEAVKTKDATIATLTGERDAARSELTASKTEARKAEFAAFCDSLPSKISPALRPSVIAMMARLDGQEPIEFGEGDQMVMKTPLEIYQDDLRNAPDVVSFSETATKRNAPLGGKGSKATAADFGEGVQVDAGRLDLHNQVLEFMEANPGKSYEQALDIVQKQD